MTGIIAIYTKQYIIAIISIIITFVSIMHHSDDSNVFFSHADLITASLGALFILFYSIFIVWRKKISIVNNKSRKSLIFLFILIVLMSFLFFYLAHFTVKGLLDDPDKGVVGPILTDEDKDNKECLILSHQINYLFYHTLWHLFGGLAGVLIVIFISKK
jgi:hypothetical protein